MNLEEFLELTRINHGIIAAIAILAGEIITLHDFPSLDIFIVSALAGAMIQAASFVIGDYWDIETDKKNKRYDRPLARGDVSPSTALILAIILFIGGMYAAYTINSMAFKIAILFSIVGLLYAYNFKKVALLGNIATAASMSVTFVFGAYVISDSVPMAVWIIALVAFFAGVGRELIKGIQDHDGDKATGRLTFAIVAGKHNAAFFGRAFILLAIITSFLPFLFIEGYKGNYTFLAILTVNALLWISAINSAKKEELLDHVRKSTMYGMLIGSHHGKNL
jgi:geranylgeranylglycerol-phosphate geranylgeranyltransferase